jgi:hypothetical protein
LNVDFDGPRWTAIESCCNIEAVKLAVVEMAVIPRTFSEGRGARVLGSGTDDTAAAAGAGGAAVSLAAEVAVEAAAAPGTGVATGLSPRTVGGASSRILGAVLGFSAALDFGETFRTVGAFVGAFLDASVDASVDAFVDASVEDPVDAAAGVTVRVAGRPARLVAGPRPVDAADAEEGLEASGEPVSADATATPDQTAAPTPRATARPPTRPI